MTALTVVPDDLATYLGTEVDENRAAKLLDLSMKLAASVVSPVPEEAEAIILTSAGRAYTNPQGLTQELVGPYQASRPSAGIYFTKAERSALRLLAGGGGAFSIDLLAGYPDDRFTEEV